MRHSNEIRIEGFPHPIFARRNPRARRFTLRVSQINQQAILTLPSQASLREARRFVSSHLVWLKNQMENIPPAIPFADGNLIPLRGNEHLLQFIEHRKGQRIVKRGIVRKKPALFVTGGHDHAPRRLSDWLKKQARQDLERRVTWHAARLKLRPKRITVRDQRSRWGSCSTTGALSFSWRLILAPTDVLDYVAAHEVAHLAEMNHGPRFWALVKKTMPEMESAQDWLKLNGASLHRYGAELDENG